MNLILFERAELNQTLRRDDRRSSHILEVLRRSVGESFDAGVIDGPKGKATIIAINPEGLTLEFAWETGALPPLDPITLIVGLPRPQTARDILREAATLGIATVHFVATEKGERSYAQSSLWSSGEWRRHLVAGAEQAFCTRLPAVMHSAPLLDVFAALPHPSCRLALDNYESPARLGAAEVSEGAPCVLAIGSERGWSTSERQALRAHDFNFVHLGARVLRTESAVIAAVSLVRAKLGLM